MRFFFLRSFLPENINLKINFKISCAFSRNNVNVISSTLPLYPKSQTMEFQREENYLK